MQINSINSYTPIQFCSLREKLPKIIDFYALNHDVFEKNISFGKKPKPNPFGVDMEYKNSVKSQRKARNEFKKIHFKTQEAAKWSADAGIIMKDTFDKKYGENSWVFISIGTSPAGIGRAMEYMGVDVRYVPISNMQWFPSSLPDEIKEKMPVEYKNYLDLIGLNKKEVENDNKHYIICDYTNTGASLENADYVAGFVLGFPRDKYNSVSINNVMEDYFKHHHLCGSKHEDMTNYEDEYLRSCEIERYSGIPHLSYNELELIEDFFDKKPNASAVKDFELALCCYLKRIGKLKQN